MVEKMCGMKQQYEYPLPPLIDTSLSECKIYSPEERTPSVSPSGHSTQKDSRS